MYGKSYGKKKKASKKPTAKKKLLKDAYKKTKK